MKAKGLQSKMTTLDLLTVVSSRFNELATEEVCWEGGSLVRVGQTSGIQERGQEFSPSQGGE